MKKLLSLLLFALMFSCSGGVDGNLFGGGTGYVTVLVPQADIPGEYQGNITYWANSQDYIDSLSQEQGYQIVVNGNSNGGFTFVFDSTFLYEVPNLNFLVGNVPVSNAITLDDGQAYMSVPHLPSHAGQFGLDTLWNQSQIFFEIQIQPIASDTSYFLSFSASRAY